MRIPRKFHNRVAITISEYAMLFCISERTVKRKIKSGEIPLIENKYVGSQPRIDLEFVKKTSHQKNDSECHM